ncbi:CoA transferase [Nocardioides sp. MAHUQ-72]|uniref:CoA transferase n=1 Tax=unclassified Nocardioides TaxID=2615069 RepID=UPI0036135770
MGAVGRFGQRAWSDLGGDPELLERVQPLPRPVPLASSLAVGELAADSVAVASLAAGLVGEVRRGRHHEQVGPVTVAPERVAASYRSERMFRRDGEPVDAWAPLSGFWPAADGWVRSHANYPHHAERLRALLGLSEEAGPDEMRAAVAARDAGALEDDAAEAGAIVFRVRDAATWAAHPQAAAIDRRPLLDHGLLGDAEARPWPEAGPLPLSGVRVLDLTRVIAGPVATRDLALAGADVLRIDSPRTPEIEMQHLDTGQGKRSALLDLGSRDGRATLEELLERADVVVSGYRPGSLARFGLDDEDLAERHPGLVVARVSTWDSGGPWSARRGFDSIVQATIGIALAESPDGGETPGALPAQALDHSAGHLLAAGVLTALARQRSEGGSHRVSVALARVGHELLAQPPLPGAPAPLAVDDAELPVVTGTGSAGTVTCAPPVLGFHGAPTAYRWIGRSWGADEPRWA